MAIPHIVALYQWLRGKPGVSFSIPSDHAFAAKLHEVITQSKANKDIFIKKVARLRAFGQEPDANDLKSIWFDNSEDYDGLTSIVEFMQDQFEQGHPNFLQVTLNYLFQHPEIATNLFDTFNMLFATWLSANPNGGCAWYEDDDIQEKLSKHQGIHLALGRLVTEHYQHEAQALFKSVTNPLGLIPLFAEHYDNPQRIAAFILGLLECGVTADVIIKSDFLHQY